MDDVKENPKTAIGIFEEWPFMMTPPPDLIQNSPVHWQNQTSLAPLLDDKPIAFFPQSKHTLPSFTAPILNSTHHNLYEFSQSLTVAKSKIAESIAATATKPHDVNYITIHVYAAVEYLKKIGELDYILLEGQRKIATMH
ncbi:hypothetical protein GGR50DRAFT_690449 [Xylaria sp. CBS 124048]|nr:hypothetical protein GGR50DRAFT_690449 [Xylaria sp. CBS 124048]